MRFKRYKRNRRYKRSTNVIRMKFQSFMDISTSANSMQIITISAGGPEILRRLSPQFSAYKYYKIGKVSVKLVPASTLPVSPSGLSIATGDTLVDPRDQLTPGLMRITNGEDVFEDLTGLTDDQQHGIYNTMLLDPRWYKWMLQTGVKRYASPRYWQVGQLHQDKWPGSILNMPNINSSGAVNGTDTYAMSYKDGTGLYHGLVETQGDSSPYGLFQVGHRGVLGWLPTDGLARTYPTGSALDTPLLASPPEVEIMKIILPKAYKTRYWYRAFITEEVLFKEPIVNFGISDSLGSYRPLDIFHLPVNSSPMRPSTSYNITFPDNSDTGGNYGND